jgi:hypothetical protein
MAAKLDAFSSQDLNLDTDGNEQYGDFYGGMRDFIGIFTCTDLSLRLILVLGPPVLENADSEENDLLDLMLDSDVNWLVEAAFRSLHSSSPAIPQRQQSSSPNFGQLQEENISSPVRGPSNRNRVPAVISIDSATPHATHSDHADRAAGKADSHSSGRSPPHEVAGLKQEKKLTPDEKREGKLLVSKSLPQLKPLDPSVQTSVQFSKTTDKKSIKGLLKGVYFEQDDTASPYLQHLKKPNPYVGIEGGYALHKAIFSQKVKPKKVKKTDSEVAQEKIAKLSKMKIKQPAKLELKPFTPMTSKGWEMVGIRPDQQAEDLFSRVEGLKNHYNTPKALHPTADDPHGGNTMASKPLSAKLIRATSPTSNMYANNIDQLVSEQFVPPPSPGFRPIQSPVQPSSAPLSPQQQFDNNNAPKSRAHTATGIADEANRIDAMDMLANIHNDPLYRIIKEEMDRIQRAMTPSAGGVSSHLKLPHADPILPAHIKVLGYFQSLPPSVWVTCRLIYFLIAAYYETVIVPPSFQLYRESTQLEAFWAILDRHYRESHLSLSTISRQFSWALLQDLMKVPKMFCKALELIENGVRLGTDEWSDFREKVDKAMEDSSRAPQQQQAEASRFSPHTPAVDSRPSTRPTTSNVVPPDGMLLSIVDDETFRSVFYELFPVAAFQPLRDMVKAGRGFLLSSSLALFAQAGHGAPIVPGTPLAVSVALTSWVKRVIAMLYISGTQRVRLMRAQQQPLPGGMPSRSSSPTGGLLLPYPMPSRLSPSVGMGRVSEESFQPKRGSSLNQSRPGSSSSAVATSANTNAMSNGQSLLPPNLSFACVFNGLPGHLLVTPPDFDALSSSPSPDTSVAVAILRRYLRFFAIASSLIKPSDQLDVLLHALPSNEEDHKPTTTVTSQKQQQQQQQPVLLDVRLQHEIEHFLRLTTASPLHKVKRFDYTSQFPILAEVRFVHPWMEALHPWLAYQVLVQAGIIPSRSTTARGDGGGAMSTPASPAGRQPITRVSMSLGDIPDVDDVDGGDAVAVAVAVGMPPVTATKRATAREDAEGPMGHHPPPPKVYDMVIAPFFNHSDAPTIEPLVLRDKAFHVEANLARVVREKSCFSVALVSESKNDPMQAATYGLRVSIKGNRYVVAVSESPASWNAFQMACRLAKESDTIIVVHVPTLRPPWDTIDSDGPLSVTAGQAATRGSLTRKQYDDCVRDMQRRRDALVELYRTVGYNLLCAAPPSYVDYARHILETYITSNRLKTEAMQQLGAESTMHPYDGYRYYQRNMETRLMARSLLHLVQPLQPDVLVLGGDADDVLNALSYHYLHPHLAFKPSTASTASAASSVGRKPSAAAQQQQQPQPQPPVQYSDHQYLPHHRPEHHHFPAEHYQHPPQQPLPVQPQPQQQPQQHQQQQQPFQPHRQLSMASVPLTIVEDIFEEIDEAETGTMMRREQVTSVTVMPDDALLTTIDSVTIIDVHDENLEYRRGMEQQRELQQQQQQQQEDDDDEESARPLVAHGRMNSQLTMISALTDAADNYQLLSRVPHSGRESDQLSQSAGGNYEDDDDFVIAEDVEGEANASSVPATMAAVTSEGIAATAPAAAVALLPEESRVVEVEEGAQEAASTTNGGGPMGDKTTDNNSVDYNDLESFIIEDNDEGENSLSASPFLPHRLGGGGGGGGVTTTEESTPLSEQAVASDGRFTHPLPTPTGTTTTTATTTNVAGGVASSAASSTGAVVTPSAAAAAAAPAAGSHSSSTTAPPPQSTAAVPPVATAEELLRLQLFREFARERISFSDILFHEISTRPYWWPEYIADEMAHRQRRAWSMDPDAASSGDASLKAAQEWMHEPISCVLTHLPTTTSTME